MFTLRIHTVDFPQPIHTHGTSAVSGSRNDKPAELMGVAHLFRQLPSANGPVLSAADVVTRSMLLFVVAVPNYMSTDEFLTFCGDHMRDFVDILFLRNDGVEDRYSVLIRFGSQLAADAFYCSYNGKRFKPSEVEACHLYFVQSVEYSEYADIASTPPPDFTELPLCPICLERLDPDSSGIQNTLCDHSSHCSCALKWTYLSCPVCRLCHQKDEEPACAVCGTLRNLWICLICGFVGCGRYEKGHASGHWSDKKHNFSLELEKQEIWDYAGDKYVQRLHQSKIDGRSPNTTNSRCSSHEECGTGDHYGEEGLESTLFNSKIEGILDEYNRLLASELDTKRQHYTLLLAEAEGRRESSISKAVEFAVSSRKDELTLELEECKEEKQAMMKRNEELLVEQNALQNKFKELLQREVSLIKSKDDKISDLKEQIRDVRVYIETQKMVTSQADSGEIEGGTILSVGGSNPSTSGSTEQRRRKHGRSRR